MAAAASRLERMQQSRNGRIGERRNEVKAGEGRAKQRAFCIAALEEGEDLSELRELLRTAGVAVVGQIDPAPREAAPQLLPRARQARRGQGGGEGRRRQRDRLRRRAQPAPGAQPRGGARHAGRRPHLGDPRHLRRPRPQRGGQAPGRARPARVQHGPDARPVDASRAPRRERRHARHRRPRTGRVADRDRPPPGPQPHHRAAPQAHRRRRLARDDARRARARAPAADRARRLHERRQVDAAQPPDRRRGRRPRPPLPHAGPDDARAAHQRPPVPAHRHRRLHPQAAPPGRRRVRRDARTRRARPTSSCTSSTPPRRTRTRWTRCCAPSTRRSRPSAPATARACSCSTRATRSTPSGAWSCSSPIPTGCSSRRRPGRGWRRSASASRRSFAARCARSTCCCPTPRAPASPSCTTSPAISSAATRRGRARARPGAGDAGRALRALLGQRHAGLARRFVDPVAARASSRAVQFGRNVTHGLTRPDGAG